MNKLLGIGLIGAGAFGLIQLLRMKNVSDSILTRLVNPRIPKASLTGMSFRTEVFNRICAHFSQKSLFCAYMSYSAPAIHKEPKPRHSWVDGYAAIM